MSLASAPNRPPLTNPGCRKPRPLEYGRKPGLPPTDGLNVAFLAEPYFCGVGRVKTCQALRAKPSQSRHQVSGCRALSLRSRYTSLDAAAAEQSQESRPAPPRVAAWASSIGVDATVTPLHPPGDSEAEGRQKRARARPGIDPERCSARPSSSGRPLAQTRPSGRLQTRTAPARRPPLATQQSATAETHC